MQRTQRLATIAAVLIMACNDPTAPDVIGKWGGPGADLRLTLSGGTVEYACGSGTIDSAWTLTTDGHWNAAGQHFTGGGPVPPGGGPAHPAQYAGRVRGSQLTFTVTLTDLGDTLGPFVLERGKTVSLQLCL